MFTWIQIFAELRKQITDRSTYYSIQDFGMNQQNMDFCLILTHKKCTTIITIAIIERTTRRYRYKRSNNKKLRTEIVRLYDILAMLCFSTLSV